MLLLVMLLLMFEFNHGVDVNIDLKSPTKPFDHFWKSTGLCPPDPKEKIYTFLLNEEEKINYALIGSLPSHGIEQIRIHWLFDSIFVNTLNGEFDFTFLDNLLTFLVQHGLKPGFELMGLPIMKTRNASSNLILDKIKGNGHEEFWEELVFYISDRYIQKFGAVEVSSWKFETWNEPDLKNYNLLNFNLPDYLSYVEGCSKGLLRAFKGTPLPRLGGPAGLFREKKHSLCWGLLEHCNGAPSQCHIQFISFHRKGDGTAEGVLNGTLDLLDLLHNKFPNLIRIPIANDESDIITNWSESHEFRGDVRYASMIIKVISGLYKTATLSRKVKIEVLSNDNAFLNYHPYYFTQRTLFARFQMNLTQPPHNQFIKKPVYTAMGLLSLLGNEYLENIRCNDPSLVVIPTKTVLANQTTASIILAYESAGPEKDTGRGVHVLLDNAPIGGRFVTYLMDNDVTNPYKVWRGLGKPVFPTIKERELMRKAEGPHRVSPPQEITASSLNLSLNLSTPSISLVHICSKPFGPPGPVSSLHIHNITKNEVLLTWSDDKVNTKCIRTYQVEFQATCENSVRFRRVNSDDVIFLSYHYAAADGGTCETTMGTYRIRAVDYWDQAGNYSETLSYPQ